MAAMTQRERTRSYRHRRTAELKALRAEVAALREEVEALRENPPSPPEGPIHWFSDEHRAEFERFRASRQRFASRTDQQLLVEFARHALASLVRKRQEAERAEDQRTRAMMETMDAHA